MSQPTQDSAAIKELVREHYAGRIQAGSCCGSSASCCSDSTPTEIALYGSEAITMLPDGVVTTSFGCGNPIAIASLTIAVNLSIDTLFGGRRSAGGGH